MTQSSPIVDDHGNGVVAVTFTRTAAGNHLTSAALTGFAQTLDRVLAMPGLAAVVLNGEGEHFCAGRIGLPGLTAAHDIRDDLNLILEVNTRLRESPVPFIAAVEGKAFGFGCGFATQCDVTIAGGGAQFALPEMSHRLPPLIVLSYFGKFVPWKRAFELALTSRPFGAAEAREIGVATEVVAAGSAVSRALEFARMIAALDPDSVRLLRRFARQVAGLSEEATMQNAVTAMAMMMSERALREQAKR